jgi:hypothetical protein
MEGCGHSSNTELNFEIPKFKSTTYPLFYIVARFDNLFWLNVKTNGQDDIFTQNCNETWRKLWNDKMNEDCCLLGCDTA